MNYESFEIVRLNKENQALKTKLIRVDEANSKLLKLLGCIYVWTFAIMLCYLKWGRV